MQGQSRRVGGGARKAPRGRRVNQWSRQWPRPPQGEAEMAEREGKAGEGERKREGSAAVRGAGKVAVWKETRR